MIGSKPYPYNKYLSNDGKYNNNFDSWKGQMTIKLLRKRKKYILVNVFQLLLLTSSNFL